MSTHPGATSSPVASISRLPAPTLPTSVTRPLLIATSPLKDAAPVPSTTVPPRITSSCIAMLLFVDPGRFFPHLAENRLRRTQFLRIGGRAEVPQRREHFFGSSPKPRIPGSALDRADQPVADRRRQAPGRSDT